MTDHRPGAEPSSLPWEPGSASEILAASHIFVVTLLEVIPSAWAEQPSGLQQRELSLGVRLDTVLKGEVSAAGGTGFRLTVRQLREPGGIISDSPGLCSDVEPVPGARYLVLASAHSEDPSLLMQEPALRGLLPSALEADVSLATTTEQRLGGQLVDPEKRQGALLDLVKTVNEHRHSIGALAPGYFLARLGRGNLREGPLEAGVLTIVLAPDTAPVLRSVFATGLCNAALDQGATPAQRAALARSLFGLAAIKRAEELFERLVSAELYNLIFEEDAPALKASDVIHEEGERVRLARIVKGFEDERADEVAAWLRHRF